MNSNLIAILVIGTLITGNLAWSKCKSGQCKACSNKGCIKCLNLWSNYNYECTAVVGNKISNCLHEIEIPAVLPATEPTRKCLVCNHAFRLDQVTNSCAAVGGGDCYAGYFSNVRF